MNKLISAIAVALLAASSGQAAAQSDYPNRPVQLIVPYGAGGIADVGMRILTDKLSTYFKRPFVVDNRPSAGGIIAAKASAGAAPDGYTLSMNGNNYSIAAALFSSLPYDILRDFDSVSTVSFFDLLVLTGAKSKLKSMKDVIAYAKANPGKLNIATINPGSTQNLAAELFRSSQNLDVTIVPFKTSPDMATAVMRGDVDIAFEFYAATQAMVRDKTLVPLASTGPKRTPYLPDLPTMMESGVGDYEVASWNAISVPAGTPKEVVDKLNKAINAVLPMPDVQAMAKKLGMEMRPSTPEAVSQRLKSDIEKWSAVIEKAGIPKRN